jgi:hypothetical protein
MSSLTRREIWVTLLAELRESCLLDWEETRAAKNVDNTTLKTCMFLKLKKV